MINEFNGFFLYWDFFFYKLIRYIRLVCRKCLLYNFKFVMGVIIDLYLKSFLFDFKIIDVM